MTNYWVVALTDSAEHPYIQAAAELLRSGKCVAFPTETVYGLGADATNTNAVENIYKAKGRPTDNPLIVHISHVDQLNTLVTEVDEVSQLLIDAFWPGPLTLVLPVKLGAVSPLVTAGLSTVAVRMPAHPIALQLIEAAGCPLAAPSANRSGRPSPTRAEHVRDDLDGRIEAIIDAGPTGVGVESTVIEVVDGRIHLLRPGGITKEQLTAFGTVLEAGAQDIEAGIAAPKSPGMKYAHYAPQGILTLVKGGSIEQVALQIQHMIDLAQAMGHSTGILTYSEHKNRYHADLVASCGSLAQPDSTAHELFAALRSFDDANISFIVAEAFADKGIGSAVMNRLEKAAGERILRLL
ncbi:threonylcarbamoyl-AMP synthase [Paenibacillus psychroresistens]|uniref:Threonylcarbamoyl-AMP synthase n=1 Tax=Paenibacillus psychroresistens TaxID=1778678 RepID=A0A6B8RC46_9BACL|nr:L-threonylcarbamoyladenylate synthase [Paenibacillus psychroresistens]QGQ93464.1 threonylcarbamoyl-AMP synthase [Paenibacillus psychroresistens]